MILCGVKKCKTSLYNSSSIKKRVKLRSLLNTKTIHFTEFQKGKIIITLRLLSLTEDVQLYCTSTISSSKKSELIQATIIVNWNSSLPVNCWPAWRSIFALEYIIVGTRWLHFRTIPFHWVNTRDNLRVYSYSPKLLFNSGQGDVSVCFERSPGQKAKEWSVI